MPYISPTEYSNIQKQLQDRSDLLEELKQVDDEICGLCKRLNPQHEKCSYCDNRESRLQAITKAETK